MQLTLGTFEVRDVVLGETNRLREGCLEVNARELRERLLEDSLFADVTLVVARLGERKRILRVLDVIEPRIKVEGPGCAFPGFLGSDELVGSGVTYRLNGVVVMTTGAMETSNIPGAEGGLRLSREQIIDMTGPLAKYSPFSRTVNLVLLFQPKQSLAVETYDHAVRMAGLRAAHYLATIARGSAPDRQETFELKPVDPELPKVVYIYQIQSDGVVRHSFLYAQDRYRMNPTFLHPNELFDGALVNGVFGAQRIPTALHTNNPVVLQLYRRHGIDLNFLGVVLTEGSNVSSGSKSRNAYYTARLAKAVGAEGAVLTQEAGGNMIMDQMLMCRYCEQMGIKTVVITYEMGGPQGDDVPLIYTVPEAVAMVSTGNREEPVVLPEMDELIGAETILFTNTSARGGAEVTLLEIGFSTDQTGSWYTRAMAC